MPSKASVSPSKGKRAPTPSQSPKNGRKPLERLRTAQRLIAIDPGPEESAWLLYNVAEGRPIEWAKEDNLTVRSVLATWPADECAIECVQSFGMPVGQTTFETVIWCGRFIESWSRKTGRDPIRVYRKDVKMHLCHSMKATDATIRQALIDIYGPGRSKAVGLKGARGPLYGLAVDCWSALAVAITATEVDNLGVRDHD